ncbi:hypothetical protein CC1G_08300 [Coprinopsis cinerea okayama7|uniref:Uncharacterized protein n=1 Tax=Coprinopsis cinerea (strain Okayama-7 / 130 / ATCC MYA-4618 / FGSC 9003) TaxID=240176 RepID=A8PG63_COPC7|nr:hypothetical protein CC1G_08300 [Coprinopsis cinerea okayama7\|eukprot:XP_001841156.2 hypothetical protein CC1G_08300 [Coprinopsis cinerea okayama7\
MPVATRQFVALLGVAIIASLLYFYFMKATSSRSSVSNYMGPLAIKVSVLEDVETQTDKAVTSPCTELDEKTTYQYIKSVDVLSLEVALSSEQSAVDNDNLTLNAFAINATVPATPAVPTSLTCTVIPSLSSKRCQSTTMPIERISCNSPPKFRRNPSPCPSPLVPKWNRRRRAIVYAPMTPERSPRKWRRLNSNRIYRHSSNAVYDLFYYGTVHHPRVVRLNPSARRVVDSPPDPALIEMFMSFRKAAKAEGRDFILPKPRV